MQPGYVPFPFERFSADGWLPSLLASFPASEDSFWLLFFHRLPLTIDPRDVVVRYGRKLLRLAHLVSLAMLVTLFVDLILA